MNFKITIALLISILFCLPPINAAEPKHHLPATVDILGQTLHLKEHQENPNGALLAE